MFLTQVQDFMVSTSVLNVLITLLIEDHNGGQYWGALKQWVPGIDLDIE